MPHQNQAATATLLERVRHIRATAAAPFAAAQQLARQLGAYVDDTGRATFGFWIPDLTASVDSAHIKLEVLRPTSAINWDSAEQTVTFSRYRLPLAVEGDCAWGVFDGLVAGTRTQTGDFYCLTYQTDDGSWAQVLDPLAVSVPFGGKAPAELYDVAAMQAQRADRAYFAALDGSREADGELRLNGPVNVLQIHVGTASAEKTIAGLTAIYRRIADKIERGAALNSAEQNYVGYDAVQLMPIEPPIEYEAGPSFWQPQATTDNTVTIALQRPNVTNWGYDVLTVASPAVNPVLLGSKRPDEFVDFIATLHNFPGRPIGVVLDVVYGHTDNQTLPLLDSHYFAGANMYGQNLNYANPMVRAILLEMQRRKSNFGVDGVRVDGAQDFKNYDAAADEMRHDDDFLRLMNDVVQEVAGQRYRPWMVFEDGRPWPRDDWELASTYREVTKQMPNVVQWGPLTFAHNTPFLFTFWANKQWRIREIMDVGSHWITGCANHDTLRRGTQVPLDARINSYFGRTLTEIIHNAYDNPAATLFTYAFAPGVPMDFVNALHRAPWSFMRNTDDRWALKVVSEEWRFLHWMVNDARWQAPAAFQRVKAMGFYNLAWLRRFMRLLEDTVLLTDYDIDAMAQTLDRFGPTTIPWTAERLKKFARAWMDDVHDFCNVTHYEADLDPAQVQFNLAAREFRRTRPWLRHNLTEVELYDYRHPTDGAVLMFGVRVAPAGDEHLLFVANMEGAPTLVTAATLPLPPAAQGEWRAVLTSPSLGNVAFDKPMTLANGQGVIFAH